MAWGIRHFNSGSVTGNWGEDIAAHYLSKHGCVIVDRNVRPRGRLELDIIAYLPAKKIYLFVEVKARKYADDDQRPLNAVTLQKRKRMRQAGMAWLFQTRRQTLDPNFRFDVVEVIGERESKTPPEVRWIQGISMQGTAPRGAEW